MVQNFFDDVASVLEKLAAVLSFQVGGGAWAWGRTSAWGRTIMVGGGT